MVERHRPGPPRQSGNSMLGRTMDNRQIENLPLVGRDATQLLEPTPGVQSIQNENSIGAPDGACDYQRIDRQHGRPGDLLPRWRHQHDRRARYRQRAFPTPMPSISSTSRPIISAREYGRTGAGVVSVLTKSGTNTVHGPSSIPPGNQLQLASYLQTTRTPCTSIVSARRSAALSSGTRSFSSARYGGLRKINPVKLQHGGAGCAAARRQFL